MGLPCSFSFLRKAGVKPDNQAVRDAIRENNPLIVFGSYNERMYLAEMGSQAIFIPASFPGSIIRRHTGSPFMGYSGSTYLVQEVCNALFDALFHILPLARDLDQVDHTPVKAQTQLAWEPDANAELERIVASKPVLIRISAAKKLRDAVERQAQRDGQATITVECVKEVARSEGFLQEAA